VIALKLGVDVPVADVAPTKVISAAAPVFVIKSL
jgi:hypothetical protein